jgi:hypothetical protein
MGMVMKRRRVKEGGRRIKGRKVTEALKRASSKEGPIKTNGHRSLKENK